MKRLACTLKSDEKGLAAVEFAIVAPVLFALLFGVIQLGIMFYASAGMKHAVAEGARLATIAPRPSDSEIVARMTARRFGLNPSNIAGPTITHGALNGVDYSDISMDYVIRLDLFFASTPTITLRETRRAYVNPAS